MNSLINRFNAQKIKVRNHLKNHEVNLSAQCLLNFITQVQNVKAFLQETSFCPNFDEKYNKNWKNYKKNLLVNKNRIKHNILLLENKEKM